MFLNSVLFFIRGILSFALIVSIVMQFHLPQIIDENHV